MPPEDRYFRLIQIDVRHDFYSRDGDACRDLTIEPSPQTNARLAMFGFLTRQRDDGIDIIWERRQQAKSNGVLAKVMLGGGEPPQNFYENLFGSPLLFTVTLTNPRFANFTEMPVDQPFGEPPLLLSNKATQIMSSAASDLEADLKLDWGVRIKRPTPDDHPMVAYRKEIADKAAALAAGKDYKKPRDPREPPPPRDRAEAEMNEYRAKSQHFALLLLSLAPSSSAKRGAARWNGFPIDGGVYATSTDLTNLFCSCRYTLRFKARETTWRYLIAARAGTLDAESLAIVGADDESEGDFTRGGLQPLPGGQSAIVFQSNSPIAMRQQPAKTYKLLGSPLKGRKSRTVLVPALPIATTGRIAPAPPPAPPPANDAAIRPPAQPPPTQSDIYVFI